MRWQYRGSPPTPAIKTFREIYCEKHGLPAAKFEPTLVGRALHWHARPFYWLLALNEDYRAADCDFVRAVGALHRRRDFDDESSAFFYHPNNTGFLRNTGRLRVSAERLKAIFDETMRGAVDRTPSVDSAPPQAGGRV